MFWIINDNYKKLRFFKKNNYLKDLSYLNFSNTSNIDE